MDLFPSKPLLAAGVTAPKPCDHLTAPRAHSVWEIHVFPVLGMPRSIFDSLHFQEKKSIVFPSKTLNEGGINCNGWWSGPLVLLCSSVLAEMLNGGMEGFVSPGNDW